MRTKVDLRPVRHIQLSRYAIFETGEIIDRSNDNRVTTVPNKIKDGKLIVNLKKDNDEYETFDVLELLYRTYVAQGMVDYNKIELYVPNGDYRDLNPSKIKTIDKVVVKPIKEDKNKKYLYISDLNKKRILGFIDMLNKYALGSTFDEITETFPECIQKEVREFLGKYHKRFTSYKRYFNGKTFKHIKHIDTQYKILCMCYTEGVEFTSKIMKIPHNFLKRAYDGGEWTHIDWVLKNYNKYRNIF